MGIKKNISRNIVIGSVGGGSFFSQLYAESLARKLTIKSCDT